MPKNKKKKSPKKTDKAADGENNDAASEPRTFTTAKERVDHIYERSSVEVAQKLETLFGKDYPPTLDYYDEYEPKLSGAQARAERKYYKQVLDPFNEAVEELTQKPTNIPGISRWHVVIEKLLEAIDVIVQNEAAQTSFLKTDGTDRRYLLCKVCPTIAQCYGKCLKAAEQVAWAKVAVATDPTYFNAFNQLGMGYMSAREWNKALEASEKAMELLRDFPEQRGTSLPIRLASLTQIVKGETEKIRNKAMKECLKDFMGTPVRYWQEMSMPRPTKTCAFCNWPGNQKCARCKIVCYCSRECQVFDYKEHKQSCVAPSRVKVVSEYPQPDYPDSELCTDAEWDFFQNARPMLREDSMLIVTSNNCHAGGVKKALMQGESPNTMSKMTREYAIHMAALRREPDHAVEILRVLIRHGACPNVIRPDGKHLLAICRERAKWIDDDEPSTENSFFRLKYFGALEERERKESEELVELVTTAIAQHKLCRLCKARKQNKGLDIHLQVPNLTDDFLRTMAERNDERAGQYQNNNTD